MIKIGQILKDRREELGYTLSAMSVKTKVPLAKLQAIEDGNLAYFDNDLTYVKFYVRYYFNALNLNYDDYRDMMNEALNDYTETASLKKVDAIHESNSRVKSRTQRIAQEKDSKTEKTAPKKKIKPKTDVAFVSMFVISILIVLALIYVFINAIMPMLNSYNDNTKVIVVPDPIVHEDNPDDPVIPEEKILTITVIDPTHYEITGYETGKDVTLIVSQPYTSSWLGSKIDNVKVISPATGFYEKGAVYTLIIPAVQNGMVVETVVGWVYKQEITLNGIVVPIDKTIITSGDKTYFYFTFKGAAQ